ncbi:MAG: NAD(+) synthase [Tissierellia bacterium]|nr:NAD(+) synthase [Tissierellia bacterium]MDD4780170.1 NAD(+) synthase [Tissierellia bacterium]
MRDYEKELKNRVKFIQNKLKEANASGVIFGNSGGKDSALVGILAKHACENVLGVIMPCESKRNFGEDMEDGLKLANQFNIENITIDLTETKKSITSAIEKIESITSEASKNIAPRLRMATLYAIGQSKNYLVAGTGNKSERYMGYFTKWGDGAFDFNPIADLTVTEIYEFLEFLKAPENIIKKAPSAGLFEGQTDESELGVTYKEIDEYINTGKGKAASVAIIERAHKVTEHKRRLPDTYE